MQRTLLSALAVCGALAVGTPASSAELPSPPAGLSAATKPAIMPAFELPTTAGSSARSASLRGQVVIVRFWASWCSICRGEMDAVQRVHDSFKANGVTVVAISIDGTGMQAARPVIEEGKFTFVAPVDQSMNVARAFGVRGVPSTFVIDRSGTILAQGSGPVDFDSAEFRNYVKAVAARGRS